MLGWAAVAVVEVADRPRLLLCGCSSRCVFRCSLGAVPAEGRRSWADAGEPGEAKSWILEPGGEAITRKRGDCLAARCARL